MKLSPVQRRYLVFNQLIPAAVINFLINAVFGWLFFHTSPTVPLLQPLGLNLLPNSIALDLIPTTFFLILFTALVVSHQIRGHLRRGELEPLDARLPLATLYRPHSLRASLNAAALVTSLLVPLTVALLYGIGTRELPLWEFVAFKSLYATALAALFTPLVVLLALAESDAALVGVEPGM
ncbi:hypothetical protein [Endothiovibrio diazotrophicus]